MDSHRSFEFDRYPFDDATAAERSDALDDGQAYHATDITHGMEIGAMFSQSHTDTAFVDWT
jgi:hypothetical protein